MIWAGGWWWAQTRCGGGKSQCVPSGLPGSVELSRLGLWGCPGGRCRADAGPLPAQALHVGPWDPEVRGSEWGQEVGIGGALGQWWGQVRVTLRCLGPQDELGPRREQVGLWGLRWAVVGNCHLRAPGQRPCFLGWRAVGVCLSWKEDQLLSPGHGGGCGGLSRSLFRGLGRAVTCVLCHVQVCHAARCSAEENGGFSGQEPVYLVPLFLPDHRRGHCHGWDATGPGKHCPRGGNPWPPACALRWLKCSRSCVILTGQGTEGWWGFVSHGLYVPMSLD